MLGWISCFPSLPDHAPLSYCSGKSVCVVTYGRALRAIKELKAKSGLNLDEFALHSLCIFGATMLAAGEISERVKQREGRWKSHVYMAYTRSNRGFEKGVT